MIIYHTDMVILHIDMGYGLMIWEMKVSIRSSPISIWDILSLWTAAAIPRMIDSSFPVAVWQGAPREQGERGDGRRELAPVAVRYGVRGRGAPAGHARNGTANSTSAPRQRVRVTWRAFIGSTGGVTVTYWLEG